MDVLRPSLDVIRALENTSLDNGNIHAHVLHCLQNPPYHKHTSPTTPMKLYFLKQYLATLKRFAADLRQCTT